MQKKHLLPVLIGLGLIGLTILAYSPGLGGMFLFDDKPNIVDNKSLILENYSLESLAKAGLSFSSPLKRPVPMLSFAVNATVCGLSPFCFKVVNLAIHIICGLLVFVFARLIFLRLKEVYQINCNDRMLLLTASAVAFLWLLHPINLTNVLYVVQRMNSLSTLFSLAGMILYIYGRNKLSVGNTGRGLVVAAFLMTIPAVLSKENGILLPLFLLLIEIFFFQLRCTKAIDRGLLSSIFLTSIVLPVVFITAYIAINPEWLQQIYAYRNFNVYERLLSEARIFWLYVGLIYLPSNQRLSLFHDYVEISRGLFDPITTLYAVIALAALLGLVLFYWRRMPLLAFGVLFFIGGHLVESTFMPLELVFEHRNYLPSIGLLLPLCYYLLNNTVFVNTINIRRTAMIGMILLFGIVTSLRASQWGNPLLLAELETLANPSSPRVHNLAGTVYASILKRVPADMKDQYYQKALDFFRRSSQLDPKNTSGLASIHILKAREQGEHDAEAFREVVSRLRTKKITPTDTASIQKLIGCVEKAVCRSDVVEIVELGKAIEDNPYGLGKYNAISYGILGRYYWNNDLNKHQALEYTRRAVQGYKRSRTIQMNYAKMLVSMGYYDEARQVLQELDGNNFFDMEKSEIRQLRALINYNERQID